MGSSGTVTSPAVPPAERPRPHLRPAVRGKFLWRGDRKLYLRGVTYGPFRPREDGC